MNASQNPNYQWIKSPNTNTDADDMMHRVQGWLDQKRTLVWFPILNTQNFPDVAPEILSQANQSHRCFAWEIQVAEDFLHIPEGVTGWLLPIDQPDTDVVVGLWQGEMNFLAAVDQATGQPQTLLSSKGIASIAVDSQYKRQNDATGQ